MSKPSPVILQHLQRPSNNPILSRINLIPRIATYIFKIILILSSHLRLGLPKGLFPVGLPVKNLKALLPSSILATCPAHLYLIDLITLTILGERYKLCSFSLWSLLHSPFSSLLGPNIRPTILFSNILSLHSSLNARDYVSQPYSTTDNIGTRRGGGKIKKYKSCLSVDFLRIEPSPVT